MLTLHENQRLMRDTLMKGPDAYPDGLFMGSIDDIVRGLKIHANTISYARLISLEAMFPRARDYSGHDVFNILSRDYNESCDNNAATPAAIGQEFPAWLAAQGADPTLIALTRFECCWLESYHAADAKPLTLQSFAGKNEAQMMKIMITRHPASRLVPNDHGLDHALGLGRLEDVPMLLITRPHTTVNITELSGVEAALFEATEQEMTLRNILTAQMDCNQRDIDSDDLTFPALMALIEAGAFTLPGEMP